MPTNLMYLDQKTLIKYGVYLLIAIAIIITICVVWKKFGKKIDNKITEKQQEYINELEIDQDEVSIPVTQMNTLVSKLKTAFGKYGWGTDEDQVYAVFDAINNRSELFSLINAFGVHKDHILSEWMAKELNASELEHVNGILASKGINYTF